MSTATATKERPITFSAEMVRAIREGRKTQTRRIVKPQPGMSEPHRPCCSNERHYEAWWDFDTDRSWRCPYGLPGDRLWVREELFYLGDLANFETVRFAYAADCQDAELTRRTWKSRRAMFLPKSWSRIKLEITEVEMRRLEDMSASDCVHEGVTDLAGDDMYAAADDAFRKFRQLWDRINGDGAYAENPWVWALTFKVVEGAAR